MVKTLEDISKNPNKNIRGGFAKACDDINEYIWQHGTEVLPLYLQTWLQSEGRLSYQVRKNELALLSNDGETEFIMFIIDGYMDEVKMFTWNSLFEFHTREITWYFNDIGMPISKKVEEY